ncbi:MAG: AMP-binding protein [Proteobacteria bacterium]|nr:AMP-binding protein [Pseudomonadota bacterium]
MLLQNFLENTTNRTSDKTALVVGKDRLTFQEVEEKSNQLAHALKDMGVERGDRVAILLDNSVEAVISIFGVLKADAVFSVLSPTIKSKKLAYILNNSEARVLITHRNKFRILQPIINQLSHLDHTIFAGPKGFDGGLNSSIWNETLSGYKVTKCPTRNIDVDLASIIYTSGSTGEPKGVMLTHLNMVSAARSITTYLENNSNDIILSALPLSFDYGLYQALMASLFGGTLVLERSFLYLFDVIRKIPEEKVTGFPLVPTMAAMLLQMEKLDRVDISGLRYITNTAAALPVTHIKKLQSTFPHVMIYSMYGLTECKRVSYLPPAELDRKPTSVGHAMPNEEVYVVDKRGQKLGPGQVGELVVRGSNVMKGYWRDPDATDRMLKPGPYPGEKVLYTGDLFKMDIEGYLYFVARKDDLIKSRGERVSPKEVEDTLHQIDGVAEAAVMGVADEILGQAIKAFIISNDHGQLTEKQVIAHCTKNLEYFMVPKYVEFVTSFPRTSTGKIDKKELSLPSALSAFSFEP